MFVLKRGRNIAFAVFFFFNDTATTEIYTLSLHDALPISSRIQEPPSQRRGTLRPGAHVSVRPRAHHARGRTETRSEEHTSELQSHSDIVCRLLLEKKNGGENSGSSFSFRPSTTRCITASD